MHPTRSLLAAASKAATAAAITGTSLLTACGGGGGGSDTATDTTSATVALSGTAAKGLMANADVAVYAVNADGTPAATPLATATTDTSGRYTLNFAATKDQPFVVKVSAKTDGSTTHADEVSGQSQPLPSGFVMRSMVVPAASGSNTVSASITPFSEMAVAAAEKATGGITTGNAAQAVSTVTQLLGFNPTTVAATTVDGAASGDEQKLAVMLTAVSQMANSGALGCETGEAGDKVRCVVEALGAATTTTTLKLSSGSGDSVSDVSAALGSAVTTVLADPALAGSVSSSSLATVVANLECTTNCAAATSTGSGTGGSTGGTDGSTGGVSTAAKAIAGAKLLFTQMKSDWLALFSRSGATAVASGAANVQAFKFRTAMDGAHLTAETLVNDAGTLLLGIDLYNDYKAGRTSSPSRGRAPGFAGDDGSANFSNSNASGCTLYQDVDRRITATAPDNANTIGCAARYFYSRVVTGTTPVTREWRHAFGITPNSDGSFGWQARARQRDSICTSTGCTLATPDVNLQLGADGTALAFFTGTVNPTLTDGHISAFTMAGELPGGFVRNGTTLANHKHTLELQGTQTRAADGSTQTAISGALVAFDAEGNTVSTLTVKTGEAGTTAVSRDAAGNRVAPSSPLAVSDAGFEPSSLTLNLVFTTASAEAEGLLALTGSTWDKSGTELVPTRVSFTGALRNLEDGMSNEFIKGQLTVRSTGYAAFDETLPRSATNQFTLDATFVGSVTAPGRPTLELTLAGTEAQDSDNGTVQASSLQYRSLVGGRPRLVVSVTGTRDASTGKLDHFTLTEASANLSAHWRRGASNVELVYDGSLVVGSMAANTGMVTFSDSSISSLDIGL